MNQEFKEKYYDFKRRLFERLYTNEVNPSIDEVSIYDVLNTMGEMLKPYNFVFVSNLDKEIDEMNRKNGYNFLVPDYKNKSLRRIGNISFNAQSDGYYYARVTFVDGFGKTIGTCDVDNTIKVGNADEEIIRNKKYFVKYLDALNAFVTSFPGLEYRWDVTNPYVKPQYIGDEFLQSKLDLNNLENPTISLTNMNDIAIATIKHKPENGELYDYISFYDKEVMKKTPVQVEELDPFVKNIVINKLNLEKGPVLKR